VFAQKQRLPRASIPDAIKTSKRLSTKHLTLLFPREGRGYAVIVSKKTVRLANQRNSVKRRITSILRGLSLPPALIIFPKSSLIGVKYKDLAIELTEALQKRSP
jgi:ribonuclease P protein component